MESRTKNYCTYCEGELDGSCSIDVGKGELAHPFCFHRSQPFQKRKTFREVLANHDDQVLVFDLLEVMIEDHQQYKIIEAFNQIMSKRHEFRVKKQYGDKFINPDLIK